MTTALLPALLALALAQPAPSRAMTVPVVVVSYFPVDGDRIDKRATGDWDDTLESTRAKCRRMTRETLAALEEGSRFRGYKNPQAPAALRYRVVANLEFLKPLPTCPLKLGEGAPMTDYNAIMAEIGARRLVEGQGVKEIWIWGYHGGKVGLWESNMAGPWGDISNSSRDRSDLPVYRNTYTVYHYNYQRGTGEAVEDHTHQIEAVLNYVDGRDRTPESQWPGLLFWGKFVGSDISHKITTRPAHCGWTHYPPNAEKDYDWANPRQVETDIEDWRPDGGGAVQAMSADRWGRDGLKWKVYWMQAIPGLGSGLTYHGKSLTNWWRFIGDFDGCMKRKMTLVAQ